MVNSNDLGHVPDPETPELGQPVGGLPAEAEAPPGLRVLRQDAAPPPQGKPQRVKKHWAL